MILGDKGASGAHCQEHLGVSPLSGIFDLCIDHAKNFPNMRCSARQETLFFWPQLLHLQMGRGKHTKVEGLPPLPQLHQGIPISPKL